LALTVTVGTKEPDPVPAYDFAVGVYEDGYGSITARIAKHTRRVLFAKPDLALIVDTLEPADASRHSYEARWNLNTTHTIEDASTSAIITQDAGAPNLALIPLQTEGLEVRAVSGQTTPEILGWYIFKDHIPSEVPATTVLHTIAGMGVQNLVTLLVPLQTGASLPISGVHRLASDSWDIRFKDGRQMSIVVDADTAGGIQISETLASGNAGRRIAMGR
jgi:hypothetical protein